MTAPQKRLMVWVGPVSSAKSTAALGMAHRFQTQGKRVLLVRPRCSIRSHEKPGEFRTKNGFPWPSVDIDKPPEILEHLDAEEHPSPVVWIDEPALFSAESGFDLYNVVSKIRETRKVMVSGLSATSELDVFCLSTALILATADEIHQCFGDCQFCEGISNATRSLYIGDEEKTGKALVGGADVYQPACEKCWNQLIAFDPDRRNEILMARRRAWNRKGDL